MKPSDRETVLAFARHDMKVVAAAEELRITHNALAYRLDAIYKATHFNPRNFYDLIKLVEIAERGDGYPWEER